jgi:hypothetical protein
VAQKPMEVMVGVQYAKIERWLGTPLSKPNFILFIKVYRRNFKIIFLYSEKLFINITHFLKLHSPGK